MHELRTRLADRRNDARDRGEDGFTLIELMVVILIIAILIAIAIPTFLGARQKAQDRAAQSNLRNALTAAKTAYVDSQNYSSDGVSVYASIEPSLTFVAGASSGQGQVSVNNSATNLGASEILLAAKSASGECFYIDDDTGASGGAGYYVPGAGTWYAKQSGASCDATALAKGTLTFTNSW
jgi:type IV pilus assembly protein PilA